MEKWSNLLIDFRLAGHRHQKPASMFQKRQGLPGAESPRTQGRAPLMPSERTIIENYG